MRLAATTVLAAVTLATVLLGATGLAGRAYRDADFVQYYAGARLVAQGVSPYDLDAWTAVYDELGSTGTRQPPHTGVREEEWTTPYPLWLFLLLAPLGLLPFAWMAALWLTLEAASIGLAAWLLGRAVFRAAPRRDAILFGGLVISFQPGWSILAGGNVTGFLLVALVATILAAVTGRPVRAGLAAVPLALKPHLFAVIAVVLLVVAARGRVRAVVAAAAGLLGLVVAALAIDPRWIGLWLANASRLQASAGSNATGWTADRVLGGIPLGAVLVGVALALLAVWWRTARPAPLVLAAAAVPVSLFVAPHGWSYDYVLLVMPLAVAIALVEEAPAPERVIVLVALGAVFGALPWALRYLAYVRGGEEWNVVLLIAAAVLVVVLERRHGSRAAMWHDALTA